MAIGTTSNAFEVAAEKHPFVVGVALLVLVVLFATWSCEVSLGASRERSARLAECVRQDCATVSLDRYPACKGRALYLCPKDAQ